VAAAGGDSSQVAAVNCGGPYMAALCGVQADGARVWAIVLRDTADRRRLVRAGVRGSVF
jgi:hypothetical protein